MELYGFYVGYADFPNKSALTLYYTGCNLGCPYCYNKDVVVGRPQYTVDDAIKHMENLETFMRDERLGIVFSGGEPTLAYGFERDVDRFYGQRLLSLHTNGLIPVEDKFDSVILSLKTTGDGITYVPQYIKGIIDHMENGFSSAKHKELRVVDSGFNKSERLASLTVLEPVAEKNGWTINIVKPYERA